MPEGEDGTLLPNHGFEAILIDRCALERIQLERLAYFCADSRLSVPGKPVLNRTVTLKDSWAKA